ncbi:iron-containing alcohol dehydrogenase [Desulfosporosinus sp. PR]|uniref:iron-containing alcohol dehydrogenase n=1 Tax=Candidatus Desulfosporosinus nitrosoreducens TaxID=3401928 RepID=UPI0027F6B298|nr:iron-containing alcohol dehydrogenase [Desulfosporosinus sp. PR]MDQ7095433.1 iron-containing alcohol dehydrogenase [Desulfosporosinus sp. PR]
MENNNTFEVSSVRYPQVVHMGSDSLRKLGQEAVELGGHRVMVIADKGIVAVGIAETVQDQLKESGLEVYLYSEFKQSPSLEDVNTCAAQAREKKIDLLVGVGGGSSIDVTKSTAILGTNSGNFNDYLGLHNIPKRGLPKILIPTTAGSGSEASQAVVLKDEVDGVKKVAYSRYLMADTVILDPLLTLSMPRTVTVDSGLDALITSIEHYISLGSNPPTDIAALESIRLIAGNLRTAFAYGRNIKARYDMLLGSFFAGASSSAGLGGIHCLCYPLESLFQLTHGRANAVIAPHVLEFNRTSTMTKFSVIAEAMGEKVDTLTLVEASKKAVSAMREILADLGVSTRLRDYNVSRESLSDMAELAVKSGSRLLQTNPRILSIEDAKDIYEKAW